MSASYKQRLAKRRKAWSQNASAAKDRKRMAESCTMRDVGGLVTDGCLGAHVVRLLDWPGDVPQLAPVVDGRHCRPRSLQGIVRCLAKAIWNKSYQANNCALRRVLERENK